MSARELAGRSAVVLGLGEFGGGSGTARYLVSRGARVLATDLRPAADLGGEVGELEAIGVELALGGHRESDFERCDLVVVNPAVPPDSPWVALARARGARITTALDLLLEALPAAAVCVTGTQGKSSTCRLLADLIEGGGRRAHLGGNIGGSLLPRLDAIGAGDVAVVEVSSYQLAALEDPARLRARVAAVGVTNVLADHLERHGTIEAYAAAKRRVLDLLAPGGTAVLPEDDSHAGRWPVPEGVRLAFRAGPSERGLGIDRGSFTLDGEELAPLAALRLPGRFQRANALVALGLASALGVPRSTFADSLGRARGLPHRLEDLGEVAGHRVWDNGVSTTPDSTLAALVGMEAPCVLLCGGKDKGLPLEELAAAARGRARLAVAFGAARARLAAAFGAAGVRAVEAATLEEAVERAFAEAAPGEPLLFSPACASYDAFANFRRRAERFRELLGERSEAALRAR